MACDPDAATDPTPYGHCYRTAWEWFNDTDQLGLCLCHGFPTGTVDGNNNAAGLLHGHAWVELVNPMQPLIEPGRLVVDCGSERTPLIHVIELPEYYRIGQIDPAYVARYDRDAALAFVVRAGTYGPWHTAPPGVMWKP